jgi:Tol biopolymer transport system component
VSHASGSLTTAAAGESYGPLISTDGGALLFLSHAAGSPSSASNSVIRGIGQYAPSQGGRRVAYASHATDLSAGQADTNDGTDIFLWDRTTGENTLVSHASGSPSQAADGDSFEPGISADGRRVAFISYREDVVPGQVDNLFYSPDVFLWDRASGTTALASHTPGSLVTTGDRGSDFHPVYRGTLPVLSADGRWLVFESSATNLVQGQTGPLPNLNVFLFDGDSGSVTLVSHAAGSPVTMGSGWFPTVSADGRFVAFNSFATDLVPGQIDGYSGDHFLYDRAAGTISLISHAPGSEVASGGAEWQRPQISADGAWAVFGSRSPDLVPDDLDSLEDVYLHGHPGPGQDFYTLTPCRVVDTRQQGPALASGVGRTFLIAGTCGIPATARSVQLNVTVFQPGGNGRLTLYPGDLAAPLTSTINFRSGETRANNAALSLALDGTGTLAITPLVSGGGTVHVILDVSGYFQ